MLPLAGATPASQSDIIFRFHTLVAPRHAPPPDLTEGVRVVLFYTLLGMLCLGLTVGNVKPLAGRTAMSMCTVAISALTNCGCTRPPRSLLLTSRPAPLHSSLTAREMPCSVPARHASLL